MGLSQARLAKPDLFQSQVLQIVKQYKFYNKANNIPRRDNINNYRVINAEHPISYPL